MSGPITVDIKIVGFRNERGQFAKVASDLPRRIADLYDREIGPRILTYLESRSPSRSGTFAKSWAMFLTPTESGASVDFDNTAEYGEWVIKGRRPGPIPRVGVANMHFFTDSGDEVFIKQGTVWHPGTKPLDIFNGAEEEHVRIALPLSTGMVDLLMQVNLR